MNSILPSVPAVSPRDNPIRAARGAAAARQFESDLIGSLLQSLEKSFAGLPGESTLSGVDNYDFLGTQALAEGIAAHGGFGIASLVQRFLAQHEGKEGERDGSLGQPHQGSKVIRSVADRTR